MKFYSTPTRIYSLSPQGELLAEITFPLMYDNVYCINHTYVDNSLRGMGVAGKLMEAALDQIRKNGGVVTATCSYAVDWLDKHPEAR